MLGVRKATPLKNITFLEAYRPTAEYVVAPEEALGNSGVRYGIDPRGGRALLRSWTRDAHGDLDAFWHQELGQLRRLERLADATDLFPRILSAGFDDTRFHLVSAANQSMFLGDRLRSSPLPQALSAGEDACQWKNLLRIAQELQCLHSQGQLHRNLTVWSILTAGANVPDFQLTRHEWSVRYISVSDGKITWRQYFTRCGSLSL